jgi:hypothetical protein
LIQSQDGLEFKEIKNKEAINIANLVEEHGLPDIHGLWN